MEQLIMRWENDGKAPQDISLPAGCRVVNFTELEGAIDHWLDIVQYGLSNGRMTADFYHDVMTAHPNYQENKCFFVLENDVAVATLTVICDYDRKEGYIHMVACHEAARGKGFGTLLNNVALYVLKTEGMQTAHLTTDDWRIPAIKSYLRADFRPDVSTEDFATRWTAIFKKINGEE